MHTVVDTHACPHLFVADGTGNTLKFTMKGQSVRLLSRGHHTKIRDLFTFS